MVPAWRRSWIAVLLLGLALGSVGAATSGESNAPLHARLHAFYARVSLELESRLKTDAPSIETRLHLGPGGRDVRLAGELTPGVADRFARLLADNPAVERVHLTSDGGLVDEAEAIGEAIAARRLATYVPDFCVSACTLAFVRGEHRFILKTSRLGFHAPYEPGLFGQVFQTDAAPERASYAAAGLKADFIEAALGVPSDDLWIPDAATLLGAGVATEVVDGSRFPDSTLDDSPDLGSARTALLSNFPPLRILDTADGAIVDAIAAWYLDAYRTGLSEAEAVAGIERLTARTVALGLSRSDDATIVALGRYLLAAMERSTTDAPEICASIGADGHLLLARDTLRKTDEAAGRFLMSRAAAEVARIPLSERAALFEHASHSKPARHACGTVREAYSEALARPIAEAAGVLRRLAFTDLSPRPLPRPTLELSALP